jgi:hypothetical protein
MYIPQLQLDLVDAALHAVGLRRDRLELLEPRDEAVESLVAQHMLVAADLAQ